MFCMGVCVCCLLVSFVVRWVCGSLLVWGFSLFASCLGCVVVGFVYFCLFRGALCFCLFIFWFGGGLGFVFVLGLFWV